MRDIKFHARSRLVASLGADGFVHTWTAELQPLHMVCLRVGGKGMGVLRLPHDASRPL